MNEPTQFIISLSQEDRRAVTAGGKYPAIAIEVYNNDGKRVSDVKCGTLVATNPESYIFRREGNLAPRHMIPSVMYVMVE